VGVPRRYGTASKVAIAVSALAAVVSGLKTTGVLAAEPLTYQAAWDDAAHPPAPPTASPDGRKVTLFYWGGRCDDHANAEVNEEPTSVTITIVVTTPRHEDCGLAAIRDQVTAHLGKPVGSRRLLDGALTS
jgi:hypothetical protein